MEDRISVYIWNDDAGSYYLMHSVHRQMDGNGRSFIGTVRAGYNFSAADTAN
jgi:hypothetical protein